MKSPIIYLFLILSLITNLFAQNPQAEETNSPGEKVDQYDESKSESSIESQYTRLETRIEVNKNKIQPLYFVEEEVMGYGGGFETVTRKVKIKIYEAGQILLDNHNATLNSLPINDLESRIVVLREISQVQNQLLYLAEVKKTRPIEKQLKKLKTPEEIASVFFQKIEN